jgi:hypothetical protein
MDLQNREERGLSRRQHGLMLTPPDPNLLDLFGLSLGEENVFN